MGDFNFNNYQSHCDGYTAWLKKQKSFHLQLVVLQFLNLNIKKFQYIIGEKGFFKLFFQCGLDC